MQSQLWNWQNISGRLGYTQSHFGQDSTAKSKAPNLCTARIRMVKKHIDKSVNQQLCELLTNPICCVLCLLCLIDSLILASESCAEERTIDYVVAMVNNQAITLSALENELIIRETRNPSKKTKRKVLEELIERKLMLQEAERWGIPLARWKEKVEVEIQSIKSKYPSEALFYDELKESGLGYQELEEWLRNDLIVKELIGRRFRRRIDDTQIDQEAAQYFEENRSAFVEPMQIDFQYAMVRSSLEDPADQQTNAKQLVKVIYSHLQGGAEFRDIQQTYNNDASLLVVQDPQTSVASTKIGLAISELEINDVSSPFLTPDGYLIAKLLGKKLPRQKTYPEVSQQIKNQLIQEQMKKQIKAWLDEQRVDGDIRILDSNLAQILLGDTNATSESSVGF